MNTIQEKLFGKALPQEEEQTCPVNKVSVVGTGEVGMAIAYTLLNEGVCSELALYDNDEHRLHGELLDLRQCLPLVDNCRIEGCANLECTRNSNIIVLCAGERQKHNESRLDLIERNTKVFQEIVPNLAKHSPNAVLFVVTNPPDVMTYVAFKLSGFPCERVFGHGTNLDSCRLRYFIGEKLNIAPKSVNAWIIGEHGESAVPVWSTVSVGGVNLAKLNPQIGTTEDRDKWRELYDKVLQSASEITKLKGHTCWAPALSVAKICKAILKNERNVYSLSTCTKNWQQSSNFNVGECCFLSLPSVVGRNGIQAILTQDLNQVEKEQFEKSVHTVNDAIKKLNL